MNKINFTQSLVLPLLVLSSCTSSEDDLKNFQDWQKKPPVTVTSRADYIRNALINNANIHYDSYNSRTDCTILPKYDALEQKMVLETDCEDRENTPEEEAEDNARYWRELQNNKFVYETVLQTDMGSDSLNLEKIINVADTYNNNSDMTQQEVQDLLTKKPIWKKGLQQAKDMLNL